MIALAALLIAGTATRTVAASGEKGDWELGPYAGWAFLDNYANGNPDDDLLYGGRVGYFFTPAWSLEASYQQMKANLSNNAGDLKVNSLRLNLLYNFRQGKPFRWHVTAGAGEEMTKAGSLDQTEIGWNAGLGLRYFFSDHFALRGDAKYVSTNVGGIVDETQGNVEATAGVSWLFGGGPAGDADGDGVTDRKDDCPNTPSGAKVNPRGCPTDADGDGVFDGIDSCPDTPKGYPVDLKGCPRDTDGDGVVDGGDSCANTPKGARVDAKGCPIDSDGDGVADGIDACPNTPKLAKVDAKGCPADADGDGVADGVDACPNTPKGATVDSRGCPADADGDGVFDGIDRCPGTTAGAKVDASGCPMEVKAAPLFTDTKKSLVLEGVNFETNKAILTADSSAVLDNVAGSLKDWPDVKVEVAGFTDSKGADGYNLTLSQKRAQAVVEYLGGKGVDRSRLKAKGYGKANPVADNGTDEGRAKNRRVELKQIN